ncbi:hexosaminidase D-like isoform X2 [Lycorma delicatula]|uniref:hexosaminidase D-like isoform X2 n=1 Tax=Lycorma delicatula TaxID=130591 RepID=UPI003F5113D5
MNIEEDLRKYDLDDISNQSVNSDTKVSYVPSKRLLHLDLKGAPPLVSYLKRILPLAKELGATGVLLEWEDMFPWTNTLSPLAARNAYSRQEVLDIIETAVSYQLEVIPLVQTFGHVEFVLKHAEFAHLREVAKSAQALCPSLNSSLDLVYQMIDQIWVYVDDIYKFVPSSVWRKYAATFPQIWAASAFKGAFGETLYVPNVKRHLDNNISWLKVMSTEGPKFQKGFQGIAITGWQRYDHFAVLCELLPSAIPSLAVNLLVTSHGYFNSSLYSKLINYLSCGESATSTTRSYYYQLPLSTSHLDLKNDPHLWKLLSQFAFPGHSFCKLLYHLQRIESEVAKKVTSVTKERAWLTDYNVRHNFSTPLRIDELMSNHQYLYHQVTGLVKSAKDCLAEVFDMYTIAEWVEQRIYPMITQLEQIEHNAKALKESQTWPSRPFPILRDLERFGIPSSDSNLSK